jgi:hypothetical protein
VKQFWVTFVPVLTLVCFWAPDSWANRVIVVRVQQALLIQSAAHRGYVLQDTEAYLAHPGDRLDRVGAGIQTSNQPIVLRLDTAAGELKLAPHSRLRITQMVPQAGGGKWLYLTIEQGTVQLIPSRLAPSSPPPTVPTPRSWDGMRAGLGRRSLRVAG